ncbi:MAG: hypothetical protein WBC70_18000 [Candidatus Aminicenantales bacterium]
MSEKLSLFTNFWSPKAVGAVNDFLVKLKGEFVWHAHEVEDELFLVLKGKLRTQFRDREVMIEPCEPRHFRTGAAAAAAAAAWPFRAYCSDWTLSPIRL